MLACWCESGVVSCCPQFRENVGFLSVGILRSYGVIVGVCEASVAASLHHERRLPGPTACRKRQGFGV